jgi:hypothetical protein
LGARSLAKRRAAISCSAGSSLMPIIASAEVPTSIWFCVTSPTGS